MTMCLIIDADSVAAVFADKTPEDYVPIIDWLTKKDGALVIGGKLVKEYDKVEKAKRFVKSLMQAGRAKIYATELVDNETNAIRSFCKSNDSHIVALARISGARIVCSHDRALHKDFRSELLIANPKGHIYQTKKHSNLLQLYGHTVACSQMTK